MLLNKLTSEKASMSESTLEEMSPGKPVFGEIPGEITADDVTSEQMTVDDSMLEDMLPNESRLDMHSSDDSNSGLKNPQCIAVVEKIQDNHATPMYHNINSDINMSTSNPEPSPDLLVSADRQTLEVFRTFNGTEDCFNDPIQTSYMNSSGFLETNDGMNLSIEDDKDMCEDHIETKLQNQDLDGEETEIEVTDFANFPINDSIRYHTSLKRRHHSGEDPKSDLKRTKISDDHSGKNIMDVIILSSDSQFNRAKRDLMNLIRTEQDINEKPINPDGSQIGVTGPAAYLWESERRLCRKESRWNQLTAPGEIGQRCSCSAVDECTHGTTLHRLGETPLHETETDESVISDNRNERSRTETITSSLDEAESEIEEDKQMNEDNNQRRIRENIERERKEQEGGIKLIIYWSVCEWIIQTVGEVLMNMKHPRRKSASVATARDARNYNRRSEVVDGEDMCGNNIKKKLRDQDLNEEETEREVIDFANFSINDFIKYHTSLKRQHDSEEDPDTDTEETEISDSRSGQNIIDIITPSSDSQFDKAQRDLMNLIRTEQDNNENPINLDGPQTRVAYSAAYLCESEHKVSRKKSRWIQLTVPGEVGQQCSCSTVDECTHGTPLHCHGETPLNETETDESVTSDYCNERSRTETITLSSDEAESEIEEIEQMSQDNDRGRIRKYIERRRKEHDEENKRVIYWSLCEWILQKTEELLMKTVHTRRKSAVVATARNERNYSRIPGVEDGKDMCNDNMKKKLRDHDLSEEGTGRDVRDFANFTINDSIRYHTSLKRRHVSEEDSETDTEES